MLWATQLSWSFIEGKNSTKWKANVAWDLAIITRSGRKADKTSPLYYWCGVIQVSGRWGGLICQHTVALQKNPLEPPCNRVSLYRKFVYMLLTLKWWNRCCALLIISELGHYISWSGSSQKEISPTWLTLLLPVERHSRHILNLATTVEFHRFKQSHPGEFCSSRELQPPLTDGKHYLTCSVVPMWWHESAWKTLQSNLSQNCDVDTTFLVKISTVALLPFDAFIPLLWPQVQKQEN